MSKTVRFFGHCIGTNTAGRNMHKSTSIPRKYENCSASSHDHPCKALSTPYKQVETTSNTNLCLVFQAVTNAKTCTENGACAHEQWTSAKTMQHRNTTRTLQNLVWMSTHKETQASAGKGDKVCKTANMSKREQKSVRKTTTLKLEQTNANKCHICTHMQAWQEVGLHFFWGYSAAEWILILGCAMFNERFHLVLLRFLKGHNWLDSRMVSLIAHLVQQQSRGHQNQKDRNYFQCQSCVNVLAAESDRNQVDMLERKNIIINRTQLEGAHCY